MAEFDAKHRDLERFLAERKEGSKEGGGKEGGSKEGGGREGGGREGPGKENGGKEDRAEEGEAKDDVQELDSGREQQVESKKDNVAASQRESQKLGTATMKKLLRASH